MLSTCCRRVSRSEQPGRRRRAGGVWDVEGTGGPGLVVAGHESSASVPSPTPPGRTPRSAQCANAPGLINPTVQAFIGSGVVVHVPSLFNELDTLERKGECESEEGVAELAGDWVGLGVVLSVLCLICEAIRE